MTKEEFAQYNHELRFQLELFRRKGRSFQDFFELIMQKADPSFVMVKPMGREGDWKSDGYSTNSGTLYQCYAPEDLTGAEAARKVKEDFAGALHHWEGKMRRWVFVWSSEQALPPQVVAVLAELKIANAPIGVDHMGREGLWEIVRDLGSRDREALLGPVPNIEDAPITTAMEIKVVMQHLGAHGMIETDNIDLDLTAISDKLKRNGLSVAVTKTIMIAMPVAKLVRDYTIGMPDPNFSSRIAADLASKYRDYATRTQDSDLIFADLVEYVLGENHLKLYWAAAGIVAHYFELCDVFER